MTHQEMVRKQTADKLRAALLYASLSDQVTISSRLIERGARPEYRSECAATENRQVGADERQCPWLPFVRKQLQAIESLPDGWDSNGAPSPDARLVAAARGLVECLGQVADLPQPHVNPTRNGGVQFEWESRERYFELEVMAERAAEYLYCDEAAHVEETGNLFEEESLEEVLTFIRRVGTPQR
jgi:hypothetical protein